MTPTLKLRGSRRTFAKPLLAWYDRHQRALPWRKNHNPYSIFVSEMMLQQTQVKTVIPYFEKWMKVLPDWQTLAKAPEDRVMKLWEGLGYYRRARNLKSAAQIVLSDFGGRLPDTHGEILKLPGVGPYSAGALLSIAFQKPYALVDGNVIRVFSRLFALKGDLKTGVGNKKVWALAEKHLSHDRPGDFNQALMELGATVCLSDNPNCLICPLRKTCRAAKTGRQSDFPSPTAKVQNRAVAMSAVWIERDGKVLLRKRPEDSKWLKGLWEFPSEEGLTHADALKKLAADLKVSFGKGPDAKVNHQITNHKIEIRLYRATLLKGWKPPSGTRWVGSNDWVHFALPSAHLKLKKMLPLK